MLLSLSALLLLSLAPAHGQLPTNKLDNFDRTDSNVLGNPSSTTAFSWNENETTNSANIQVKNNQGYLVSQGTSGDVLNEYASIDASNISGYPTTLGQAGDVVTWAFNMRQTDPNPGGVGNTGTNAAMYVLASSSNDLSGNGWAVIVGDGDDTDEIKLVRYNGGFQKNADLTKRITGTVDVSDQHATVRVTYDPNTDLWTLYASFGSSFSNPINESNKIGDVQDATETSNQLNYTGMVWDHGSSQTHHAEFDNIYLSDPNGELPVELASFDVTTSGSNVQLNWRTLSETSNARFEVEHRGPSPRSGAGWTRLGQVDGAGTTTQPQAYRFSASSLQPGRHTFRLRQVDLDGTTHFSPERSVVVEARETGLLHTAPNPVTTGQAAFALSPKQAQSVTVTLVDALGRTVRTVHQGRVSATPTPLAVDTRTLSSGTYFLHAEGQTFTTTEKFSVVQ
jgi:flagellar hook assembly protein FlgD